MFAFLLFSSPSTPNRTPKAVMMLFTSSLSNALCHMAFSTLRILPRNGNMACVARLRPCLADPPAESPSTRNISHSSGFRDEQSASFPGSPPPLMGLLRCTDSLALRAAIRAVAARMTLSTMSLASLGCSSR